jgi:hypothetical protein
MLRGYPWRTGCSVNLAARSRCARAICGFRYHNNAREAWTRRGEHYWVPLLRTGALTRITPFPLRRTWR